MSLLVKTSLTLLAASMLSAVSSAQACWELTGVFYSPDTDTPPGYVCTLVGVVTAKSTADAYANGFSSHGSGRAWDSNIGCEAKVRTAAATGLYLEMWRNMCEDEGEIEFFGQAEVSGAANLIEENCAGAALGYQQIRSNILASPIDAVLTESSGETNAGELGDVSGALSGLEVSLPITTGLGEGIYQDNDQDAQFDYECNDLFTLELKSRAYIRVWANSPLIDLFADVRASMAGSSSGVVLLGTCPQ